MRDLASPPKADQPSELARLRWVRQIFLAQTNCIGIVFLKRRDRSGERRVRKEFSANSVCVPSATSAFPKKLSPNDDLQERQDFEFAKMLAPPLRSKTRRVDTLRSPEGRMRRRIENRRFSRPLNGAKFNGRRSAF